MEVKINEVSGIGEFEKKENISDEKRPEEKQVIYSVPAGKAFLVLNGSKTAEVRTDENLSKLLRDKYETVMQSRYFGRNGIEIVLSGQIPQNEIYDLIRLSYNLTAEK